MVHLAEKIVFSLTMIGFALAVWTAMRPADRELLPGWFRVLIPRFFLRNGDPDSQAHGLLYILFFLTWIPVIWLLE